MGKPVGCYWEYIGTHLRPERVFVFLTLAAGLCLVFMTGPFQANDEITHFRRAHQISQGQLIASRQGQLVGGYIPEAVDAANVPFDEVHGVQGRYFLPLVIPVLFLLYEHNLFKVPDIP